MTAGPVSVVIAAHNEEGVLDRCLSTLLRGAVPGELEVVVVCNGCDDGTEALAGAYGHPVTAVSTPIASKTGALNLGDRVAVAFPRLYVDADAQLSIEAVRAIRAALADGALAASPALKVDTTGSSATVRAYVRFWSALPSVRDDIVGRGVYALSAAGRARFDGFPDVIADDHFVRTVVPQEARVTVATHHSVVQAPRTLRSLVRRSVRIHSGNRQVDPGAAAAGRRGWADVIRRNPARIVDFPAYALVVGVAKARGRWLARTGRAPAWGRDDSRVPGPAPVELALRSEPLDASTA